MAAVASGTLSLQSAIPIVLGANVGTTMTSTIVSMGYITKTKEFRKAVAAGLVHDLFNITMILLLFPIELKYHILEKGSKYLSGLLIAQGDSSFSFNLGITNFLTSIDDWIIGHLGNVVTLIVGIVLLFACIKKFSKLLYGILIGQAKQKLETTVFSTTFRSFSWGLFITSAAQSSSLTTSLIVPLVATGKVQLTRAFQFILGANIGTTITAIVVAIFHSQIAIEIALVHFLFNTVGVLLFISLPFLSNMVISIAEWMGRYTLKIRIIGLAYVILTFFLIPFTLIYASKGFDKNNIDSSEVMPEE